MQINIDLACNSCKSYRCQNSNKKHAIASHNILRSHIILFGLDAATTAPAPIIIHNMKTFKGIVSWNRMTIWQFYCIAGNFLIARWRILNFKFFVFYFKICKNSVSPLRSFCGTFHWRVPLRRENFSLRPKILSPYGIYFLRISLAWTVDPHTNFSPYENRLKKNVNTLLADFPYGDKILRRRE
jgi:hypothetical protein